MRNELLCAIGGVSFGIGMVIEKFQPANITTRSLIVFGISIICVSIVNSLNAILINR